ncbi:MAG: ABC transporter ATP-binding protein [Betaproteobacteria bacterium]
MAVARAGTGETGRAAEAPSPGENHRGSYLQLQGVSKAFRGTSVIEGLDFSIARNEFVSLLGPSGCGKTTMLRMIAGLLAADRGSILLDGEDITRIPPHRRGVGVVFQNYALFPHLSVDENVAFGLQAQGLPRDSIRQAVPAALDLVRMRDFAARPVTALSGGQQQRVAVARALAVKPKLLLLDEPLSALDRKLRETMQIELRRILRAQGITAIFVTHDQDEALVMSDRIAVMNAGRIEQIGTPSQIYEHPSTEFVLEFVGLSSRLTGKVGSASQGQLVLETAGGSLKAPGALNRGAAVTIAVRPEHIALGEPGPGDNGLELQLEDVVYLGSKTLLYLRGSSEHVQVTVELTGSGAIPAVGDRVLVRWPIAQTLVFPG